MRGMPTLGGVATAVSTTHQNAKQVALTLVRKGMVRFVVDETDARGEASRRDGGRGEGLGGPECGGFAAISEWFAALSRDEQQALAGLLLRLARSIRAPA